MARRYGRQGVPDDGQPDEPETHLKLGVQPTQWIASATVSRHGRRFILVHPAAGLHGGRRKGGLYTFPMAHLHNITIGIGSSVLNWDVQCNILGSEYTHTIYVGLTHCLRLWNGVRCIGLVRSANQPMQPTLNFFCHTAVASRQGSSGYLHTSAGHLLHSP